MRQDLHLDGRRLSFLDVSNPADAGSHETPRRRGVVLLLHAFPLAAEMWAPQLAAVPSGWRFVAPDLRGFGASAPDAGEERAWSMDDYARDAIALLDHLDVREPVVCGLSMGGYAAFALLRLAPARVRGLVLADTRPDPDSPDGRAAREQALLTVERDGVRALAEGMLARLLGRTSITTRPRVVEAVRGLAGAQSPEAVAPALHRLMTRPDSTPLLASLTCPTLIVAGEEDEITGPDVARQMHGQVADAGLALIGHAGHLSSLEQPEAFNEALDRFLSERFEGG
jgi:pimeloyl-ACP methyl ester carboxylesterase